MAKPNNVDPLALSELGMVVCVAAGAAAGICGHYATYLYAPFGADPNSGIWSVFYVGPYWGTATGLLAGVLWCRRMVSVALRGKSDRIVWLGACNGFLVGCLATLLLHLGLGMAVGHPSLEPTLAGLVVGAPIGFLLGAACGAGCRERLLAARERTNGSEKTATDAPAPESTP